ncbi:hypothetical protein TNCV_5030111 [Trichonephila clavipes]|nr:hypothetical protein TNCV_5030111 [Trichonephila clavipes]
MVLKAALTTGVNLVPCLDEARWPPSGSADQVALATTTGKLRIYVCHFRSLKFGKVSFVPKYTEAALIFRKLKTCTSYNLATVIFKKEG